MMGTMGHIRSLLPHKESVCGIFSNIYHLLDRDAGHLMHGTAILGSFSLYERINLPR
jgi:hypothetical protein